MKKAISLLLIIIATVTMLFVFTGCDKTEGGNDSGNNSSSAKDVTTTLSAESYGMKVEGTFPAREEKDADGKTEVVSDYKLNKPAKYDDFSMSNDKVEFAFKITSHVYNTYASYKDKYGNKEGSYANYLEFLKDPDFDDVKADQKKFEETKVFGVNAVKYEFSNRMIYVLDLEGDKASKQRCTLTVYPVNSNDKIADILEDEEVKTNYAKRDRHF